MGREVTGLRVEYKSTYPKGKPNGVTSDTGRETVPNVPEGNNDVKDFKEEASQVESSAEKQEVLSNKSTNFEAEKLEVKSAKPEEHKSSTMESPASAPAAVRNARTKQTAANPPALETDKRACVSPTAVETPAASSNSTNVKSPSFAKKSQPNSPFVSKKNLDDDDNWSLASSTAASVRTTRSRTTVPVAPTFNISGRLEKRKEYYTKLEEKRLALEAEKREYEARTKEDQDAAIKQLRKTMVFRANPVPNFYYEQPPPKKELKKLPTTRAVSPKFNRRKSCSDAVSSSSEDKSICRRAQRHSLGSHKESSTPTSTPKKKDPTVTQNGNSSARVKDQRAKQPKETPKPATTHKMTDQTNADIAVQS